ncbi:MAG: hypothetical protein C4B58_12610 [Deltaproteobacteria bacterium]|nr:MAG: hypothetical protein C4B58_12610 [Deltaproteobacteria bacterium]
MRSNNQGGKYYLTVFWPLWPFRLVQNEAVSLVNMVDKDRQDLTRFRLNDYPSLPIPKNYFQNSCDFAGFRRFVLLFKQLKFENNNYEPCKFLTSISIDSFPKASRELNDRFERSPVQCHQPVKTCKQCIESLYPIIPQKLDAKGLLVSEFLTSLRNKKGKLQGYICNGDNTICTKVLRFPSWEKSCLLWIAGESLFQADKIWWGKFGIDILKEGGLNAPVGRDTTVVLGPISFFYDEIPDLVYAFFIDHQSSTERAKHLFGLTYAMNEARKAWLFDWAGRLADTIMKMETIKDFSFLKEYSHLKDSYEDFEKLSSESLDRAKKLLRVTYAREALEWMARVLAFCEASPGNALDQHVSTFLDYNTDDSIKISQVLRKIDTEQGKITIWQPFLTEKDPQGVNFQRSVARLRFIRKFLEQSADTINSALDVKGVVKIKGSKAAKLMADLVRHVRLNPLTGKILLLGAPGGGKGLTAKRYHELAIEEITKSEHLRKKTIEGIWKRLVNILMLPKAREVMDDQKIETETKRKKEKLLDFVKAQVQSTKWWQWNIPRVSDGRDNSSKWPCMDEALCTKISVNNENNALELGDDLCKTCPLKPYLNDLVQSILPNIASKPDTIETSMQFMAHYLARLLYAVYGLKNEARPKMSENLIQILCGVLAEQGPEFISSMRRLFGTAESVEMPLPGLFQTASYMGGTVFLDEIADAPVKIQDNLLGPLEEKKVSRLGWESIEEDVGNIRIVAATHKDLRARVKLYGETLDSQKPQGFRPDLFSRLIIFPPVYPSSVTEYFLYENDEERRVNQMDFISIMLEILDSKEKDAGVKYLDDDHRRRFLENLFDTIDAYFKRTIGMMDFPKSKLPAVKKSLVEQITTRLFVGILEEVALAERQAEHFAEAQNLEPDEHKQDTKKVQGHKNQKPDFTGIVREVFKPQQRDLYPLSLEKALSNFYKQTENQITKTLKDLNIPFDKQANFKKDLLNAYNKTLEMMKKPADLPEPSQAFLNARLSDILAINLPKLLNYIVNPEV